MALVYTRYHSKCRISEGIKMTLGVVFNGEVISNKILLGAFLVILGLAVYHWGELLIKKLQNKKVMRDSY